MKNTKFKLMVTLCLSLGLTACGSGGSSSSDDAKIVDDHDVDLFSSVSFILNPQVPRARFSATPNVYPNKVSSLEVTTKCPAGVTPSFTTTAPHDSYTVEDGKISTKSSMAATLNVPSVCSVQSWVQDGVWVPLSYLASTPITDSFSVIGTGNVVTGAVTELPNVGKNLVLGEGVTLTGSYSELPAITGTLTLSGLTQPLTGSVLDVPQSVTEITLTGASVTERGDLSSLFTTDSSIKKLTLRDFKDSDGYSSWVYPKDLPRGLTVFVADDESIATYGDIGNLPAGVEVVTLVSPIDVASENLLSGNAGNLPTTVTSLTLGRNNVTGNMDHVVPFLDTLVLDHTGIEADLALLNPEMTGTLSIKSAPAITGNFSNFPLCLAEVSVVDSPAITGDINYLNNAGYCDGVSTASPTVLEISIDAPQTAVWDISKALDNATDVSIAYNGKLVFNDRNTTTPRNQDEINMISLALYPDAYNDSELTTLIEHVTADLAANTNNLDTSKFIVSSGDTDTDAVSRITLICQDSAVQASLNKMTDNGWDVNCGQTN